MVSLPLYRWAMVFSLLTTGLAFVEFHLVFLSLNVPERWYAQTVVLLILSAVTSVLIVLPQARSTAFRPLLLLRFALYFIITYPLGNSMSIRLTLFSAILLEVINNFQKPWDILVSWVAILSVLFLGQAISAWDSQVAGLSLDNSLALFIFAAVVVYLGFSIKRHQLVAQERQELILKFRQAALRLVETNVALQDQIVTNESHALLTERNRISRELHDTVGYALMSVIALLKASKELAKRDRNKASDFLDRSILQAEMGLQETRAALRLMRQRKEPNTALVENIRKLAQALGNTHIQILTDLRISRKSFGIDIDAVLFKFVQEAITNAIKHSNANQIRVTLSETPKYLELAVSDNGTDSLPVESLSEGIGIRGIRERIRQFGGELHFWNRGAGFNIMVHIPRLSYQDINDTHEQD